MTICVSVKVSEGIVLAADSTATIMGTIGKPGGAPGVLKTYDHARKLLHIKDYPIGTLSWGTYLIGSRSVESIINEYEYSLPSVVEEIEKKKRTRKTPETTFTFSVRDIADGLLQHIKKYYDAEFEGIEDKPELGILVSGFSSGQYFPEQWLFSLADSKGLVVVRADINGKPDFGANWFGLTDAIIRLHHGRDDQIIKKLANRFKVPEKEIFDLVSEFQYPVLFNGMPLQDAIDYATYLVNVEIGRFRFVIGAPLCGGEIDLAVITPNAFTWIDRKTWKTNYTYPK
jgi:hypothetical protein